jgi:3-phenylpropionate/trans-cinnamate dioxygenase ferredoxin reductase subunit
MTSFETIAVVGTSLAGLRGMEALRRDGHQGRIVAIGAEPHRPYDRPPLSKQFLKGDWGREKIELRHQLGDDDVEWMLGRSAVALNPVARQIELDGGETLDYDGLLIACGSSARAFPGMPDLDGIFLLRTLADAERMRDALAASPRVAVIGAGFIGMEVAATCRELGLEVTVLEALDTPLVRGIGPVLGRHVAGVFEDHGVDLRCGVGVEGFEGSGRVEAVLLQDGTRIPADLVLVGIGAAPATDWLKGSGLAIDNGVLCDSSCATQAPDIVVAGDVARWTDFRSGRPVRIEHWTNAVEQGAHAAKRLLKGPEVGAYDHVPYVWTDQFELRIQMAGETQPGDDMHVCLGTLEEGRCMVLFGRAGKLVAAVAFKRPRQLHDYRDLIGEGASWEQALAHAEP